MNSEQAKTYTKEEVQELINRAVKQDRELQAQIVRALSVIPADIKQSWIESPKSLASTLENALCPPKKKVKVPDLPTWKTIKLGTGLHTADDFRKAFKDRHFKISKWLNLNDLLDKPEFTVATRETDVDLVRVTVSELGFPDEATRKDIYDRARGVGFELCPPEVGPQLRLQYTDQPKPECLLVGMQPIIDWAHNSHIFSVEHDDGGQCLCGSFGDEAATWFGNCCFVFVRRNPARNVTVERW